MTRVQRWHNVRGQLVVYPEIVITFRSSGYRDPGVRGGAPENSYPPEGSDERVVEIVTVEGNAVDSELAQALFEHFADDINAVEIEPPERDE